MKLIQEQIAVMTHFMNGGRIEYHNRVEEDSWVLVSNPIWNWDTYDYRIQSTPKPLSAEDFPPGTVLRDKNAPDLWRQINAVSSESFWAYPWTMPQSFDSPTLMKHFELSTDGGKTWKPCHK